MPVAKSYTNFSIDGEPFLENGRMYVNICTSKGLKKVRWYTEKEYNKMYPDTPIVQDTMNFNAYHAFGFDGKGYITIYKGTNVEEWAENDRTNIWRNLTFGYYTPSKFELPKIPAHIIPIKIQWDDIKDHENKMKSHEEVKKIIDKLCK